MRLLLTRFGSTPMMGTFGRIDLGDHILYTVEQDWENNRRGVSCIPDGIYTLEPHNSPKHPHVVALVNHALGVYHFEDPQAKRSNILIHSANRAAQLRGCISPGMRLGALPNKNGEMEWAVLDSTAALRVLLEHIRRNAITELQIVWQRIGTRDG